MPPQQYKYKAFISYSHQDKKWGDWLHKGLETYWVPKCLVGKETRYGETPKRLFPIFRDREELPTSNELDKTHSKWRKRAIRVASDKGLEFSHGIAAKLINIYLKVRFVCAGHHKHDNAKNLHPPIYALLLKALGDENIGGFSSNWRRFHNMHWSKFSSEEYEAVIDLIRRAIPGRPLWMIEQYWQGHQ